MGALYALLYDNIHVALFLKCSVLRVKGLNISIVSVKVTALCIGNLQCRAVENMVAYTQYTCIDTIDIYFCIFYYYIFMLLIFNYN